jgi:hypothetical protein
VITVSVCEPQTMIRASSVACSAEMHLCPGCTAGAGLTLRGSLLDMPSRSYSDDPEPRMVGLVVVACTCGWVRQAAAD